MKKLLLSLMIVSAVAASMIYGTKAYFSDTETSVGNTFSTGTIDISVNDKNPWSESFTLDHMKPSYTDYINFTVKNVGTNPANVVKRVENVDTDEGVMSEPECEAEGGQWSDGICTGETAKSDIDTVIGYDLYVELYNENNEMVWHQMLYNDDVTISQIKDTDMYLGMIPENWSMKVYQSYHMRLDTENWAQGDVMTFDINLEAKQLTGNLTLEDKSGDPDWDIDQTSTEKGILSYEVVNPTFDFEFSGIAPSAGKEYALVIGDNPYDAGQLLGTATADGSGNVNIPLTSVELNKSYDHAKVWLILNSDWNGTKMNGWHGSEYLYETGLIEYRDTDL